jgi:hypothetical protein
MPEQDSGTSEMEHGKEVVDVTFPAGDEPTEVVQPGEEAHNLPAPSGPTEAPNVLRGLSPINRIGRSARKRASRVAATKCGSYGEALATWTAIGRPCRSQIAMILLPFPRRVGPTAAPPFSPRQRWRRRTLRTDRSCRDRADLPQGAAVVPPSVRTVARVGSGDGTSGTEDSGAADHGTAPRCARPFYLVHRLSG